MPPRISSKGGVAVARSAHPSHLDRGRVRRSVESQGQSCLGFLPMQLPLDRMPQVCDDPRMRITDPSITDANDALRALGAFIQWYDPDGDAAFHSREALAQCDDLVAWRHETDAPTDLADLIFHLIDAIVEDREVLTDALLSNSLCPLHARDYAICFDDNDDECAAIRSIHPEHDT